MALLLGEPPRARLSLPSLSARSSRRGDGDETEPGGRERCRSRDDKKGAGVRVLGFGFRVLGFYAFGVLGFRVLGF